MPKYTSLDSKIKSLSVSEAYLWFVLLHEAGDNLVIQVDVDVQVRWRVLKIVPTDSTSPKT